MSKARFQIQSIKLLKNEQLGNGSYGMVCKAVCDGLLCAAKLLHTTIVCPRNSQNFDQECQVLSAIKHPNVIQYLGTHQDPETGQRVLIMELMDESLTSFVERAEKAGRAPLPLHVQLNICHEIALALRYLHQNDIIHRDLSGNNVLSLGGKRFKVTDFGMSKLINSGTNVMSLTQCPSYPAYMSPEALETPPVYSKKLDTFSFGVLTIQILTCRFPDPGPPRRKVRDPKYPLPMDLPVLDTERRKSHIDLIPPTHPLLGISKACLSYQEEGRPTAVELCDHISGLKLTAEYIQSMEKEYADGPAFGKLPDTWEDMTPEQTVKKVPLHVDHDEYKKVQSLFLNTISKTQAQIVSIERIQNPSLYLQYALRKHFMMMQQYGAEFECERKLFHGTAEDTTHKINVQGFNRSFAGLNAARYGNGVCFVKDARFSANDIYSPRNAAGHKHIYLSLVLTGKYTAGKQDMKVPPPKDPAKPAELYDSVVDKMDDPTLFVIFHDSQAYPEYLITFKKIVQG